VVVVVEALELLELCPFQVDPVMYPDLELQQTARVDYSHPPSECLVLGQAVALEEVVG